MRAKPPGPIDGPRRSNRLGYPWSRERTVSSPPAPERSSKRAETNWLSTGERQRTPQTLTWEGEDLYPAPTVEQIRAMSLSFPGTTSTADGWHPRWYGHLSDGALQALGQVYHLAEVVGDFPKRLQALLIKLIPKVDSPEYRPFGLFKGVYPFWCKCRAEDIRQWAIGQTQYASKVNLMPGKQTLDAVWRTEVLRLTEAKAAKEGV